MPVLHQKFGAVFLRGDWIRIGLRNPLHDSHVGNIKFVAAGGSLIGANLAFDNYARLLRESLDRVKHLRRDRIFRHYTLNYPRAVAKLREQKLPALAQVVEPAPQGDRLTFVLPDFCDGGYRG